MMGFVHTDGVRTEFLDRLRPYVLDTVRSNVVQSCDLYDRARLSRIIESYYGGRTELASQVDWWLAFEEWRQACTA